MKTFSIQNFGCRATDADASAIRRSMLAQGWSLAGGHNGADVVILNTCTVTAAADSQAREAVRKIHRASPSARIVVTGCYAQRAPEELASLAGVEIVVGNSHQSAIPELLRQFHPEPEACDTSGFIPLEQLNGDAMSLARGPAKILTGDIFAETSVTIAPATPGEGDRTRPILKIQDGCDNRCAYCVIPMVRGNSRSLEPDVVVAEARKLVEAGAKEIVLSGINLGSYGRDLAPRVKLADVVQRILRETNLEQLRFSSIEPQDVTSEFAELVADSERIARHFHIPLQSGSDRTLRAMHRWYRRAHYAERVQLIRAMLPDAAIGADVIAGFPGESDEDFAHTLQFIESLPLTYLHAFSFSARPGTKAATLAEEVPASVIRERARTLRALSQRKTAEFRESLVGRRFRALTLARGGDDWTEALTGNYLKVRIEGRHAPNEWHEAEISGCEAGAPHPLDAETEPASARSQLAALAAIAAAHS